MNVGELARLALLTALVTVATLTVRIPMPATEGYVNIGDAVIVAAALLRGARVGALAGGFGSALADLLGGYAHWAPFTLFIKGIEGALIGLLGARFSVQLDRPVEFLLAGAVAATGLAWMVFGYFAVEVCLYSLVPALASLPGNVVQAVASLGAGLPLAAVLRRSGRI